MKKALGLLALLTLVGAGCGSTQTPEPTPVPEMQQQEQPSDTQVEQPAVTPTENTSSTDVSATTGTEVKSFTMDEVKANNTPEKCWTAINGNVYDVTSFEKKHPGGDRNILKLCGMDGSSAFNQVHGGKKLQEDTLATFKIGVLK